MLQRHESYSFLPAPFGLALCGLAFCAWNLWSMDSAPCASAGCTLFRDFTLGGLSLWWLGIAGFAALLLLSLFGRLRLGRLCASFGLVLDCLLLVLMLGAAPCLSCLFAGLLLALVYLGFLLAAHSRQRTFASLRFSTLLALWACLFVANVGGLARESVAPWAMWQPADTQQLAARVYFSPSCPACRQLVLELPPDQAGTLAWHPVAETKEDLRVIGAMLERMRQGDTLAQALPAALEAPMDDPWATLRPDMLMLQFRLWRNQAHVLERGNTLPLLEFSGMPAFMLQARRTPPPAPRSTPRAAPRPLGQNPDLPSELEIIGRCGPQSDMPCP